MKTIGIIGASGYVGQHIAKLLSPHFEVTALQRSLNGVMTELPGVRVRLVTENTQTFDILINTSYNSHKDLKRVYELNHAVLKQMQAASHAHTKIIHLSSLAVFGFGLDRKITPAAVPLQNDYGYVQSKVHMENVLLQHFPAQQLSIVRLGNVWGAENGSWTQPVANALQWGLPVLSPAPAFSNITYIHNISDYIRHVITHTGHQVFHHLAEHSNIKWQQVINELSAYMNVPPVAISQPAFYAKNLADDLKHAFSPNPLTLVKRTRDGRFSSHYFPGKLFTALLALKNTQAKAFAWKENPYEPPITFYWILGCAVEFKSHTLPGWKAPHAWEDVKANVFNWIDEAGFTS